jgi:predicted Zn-dependent protease
MPPSIIEKYELILAADPRSRIFVELAKALVDRGEHARAIEVCSRGLEHHPGSVLGRVTWGRALLESGDLKGAMDQFEIAIGLEPAKPYAYNLVGEALLRRGHHREALPVLARAAELQPADPKVRAWLDEAKQRAREAPANTPVDFAFGPPGAAEEKTASYGMGAPDAGGRPSSRDATPEGDAAGEGRPAAGRSGAGPASADATATMQPTATITASGSAGAQATAAPQPPPVPPRLAARPAAGAKRSVLQMIPEASARDVVPSLASRLNIPALKTPVVSAAPAADPADAERAAAEYERQLREKLLANPPPPSFLSRHRRLIISGIVLVAVGTAAAVYLTVSTRNAARAAAGAAVKGRAGLARDTLASLRDAQRLLLEARKRSSDPEVGALAAEISAILAAEHGDEQARATARALMEAGVAGDAALAVNWILAETKAARTGAEPAILASRPSDSPLLQELAGRILVARGERESGRGRLDLAARANPPLLRALSELGDLALTAGDPEGALAYYAAALSAHGTHARSAIGAAEARLALGRDLEVSRRELDAVDADPGSAPPRDVRLRFEIARARVLAALGDASSAAARLSRAAEKEGESSELAAALAEVFLMNRSWAQAEAAAARAVAREPKNAELRVLLARARVGRGRYADALQATDGVEGRAVRLQRGIARYRLGQWAEARAELARTGHDGKFPAEAAVWFALIDVATGKAERALPLLDRLVGANPPAPLASYAQGRALEALGRSAQAEAAYRTAWEREPLAPEGPAALGRLLLATGHPKSAIEPLERASKLDASDLSTRRALGEARLGAGQASAARSDLDFVLLASPRDAAALRTLSAAWLAEGQAGEAKLAADRALAVAPNDAAVLVTAARAASAAGDAVSARRLAARALRAGAKGADLADARRLAGGGPSAPAPKGPATAPKGAAAAKGAAPGAKGAALAAKGAATGTKSPAAAAKRR